MYMPLDRERGGVQPLVQAPSMCRGEQMCSLSPSCPWEHMQDRGCIPSTQALSLATHFVSSVFTSSGVSSWGQWPELLIGTSSAAGYSFCTW